MCWSLPDRAPSLVESGDFQPSLCAAACCRLLLLVASKGQEKGNVLVRPHTSSGGKANVALKRRIQGPVLCDQLRLGSMFWDDDRSIDECATVITTFPFLC